MPLLYSGPTKFEFVNPEEWYSNPWKESFKQLSSGVHVRPGYQAMVEAEPEKYKGTNITYFDSIQSAMDLSDEVDNLLIFVHKVS